MRAKAFIIAIVGALAFGATACKVKDPLYCDVVTPCTAPGRPFCDEFGQYPASEGVRRTCIPHPYQDGGLEDASGLDSATADASEPCTVTGCSDPSRPVCDPSGQCRRCRSDTRAECPSEVCDDTSGACSPADQIIYVDQNIVGADTPGCGTQLSPCASIVHALTLVVPTRQIIHAKPGPYLAPDAIIGKTATIVAPGSSLSTRLGTSGIAIIVGEGSDITIDGATIGYSGALGGATCTGTVGLSALRLRGVTMLDNQTSAPGTERVIDADRCRLVIEGSNITGHVYAYRSMVDMTRSTLTNSTYINLEMNASTAKLTGSTISLGRQHAVMAYNSDVTVDRCLLLRNGSGAVFYGSEVTITNSVIAKNGDGSGFTGGISLRDVTAGKRTVVRFNTIIANQNNGMPLLSGPPVGAGVGCDNVVQSEPFVGNIVRTNTGGPNAAPSCLFEHSNVEGITAGTGSFDEEARLVDWQNDNFHLAPNSPCRNRAGLPTPPPFDIDGDPRPSETAPDVGADEFVP